VSTHDQAGWYLLLYHMSGQSPTRPYFEVIGPFLSRPAAIAHARQEADRDPAIMARVLHAEGKPYPRSAWHDAVPVGPP
jgi:hypothetical protein